MTVPCDKRKDHWKFGTQKKEGKLAKKLCLVQKQDGTTILIYQTTIHIRIGRTLFIKVR